MSLFSKLEEVLPSLTAIESTALNIASIAGHDISEGSAAALKAAESAWKFLATNIPEIEAIGSIIAPQYAPAIQAAGAGVEVVNSLATTLQSGHVNIATLGDQVSQLAATVAENIKVNNGSQQAINVANQVSSEAAKVASASTTTAAAINVPTPVVKN